MARKTRLEELAVEITANAAAFRRELRVSEGDVNTWSRRVARRISTASTGFAKVRKSVLSARTAFVGLAASLGGAALARATQNVAALGNETNKTARAFGLTGEELQRFRFAGEQLGTSQQNIDAGFVTLNKRLGEFVNIGVGEIASKLQPLAPVLAENLKAATGTAEAFLLIADEIANTTDRQRQFAIAAAAFDKGTGAALIRTLASGREEIERYGDEAQRAGLILSDDAAVRAERLAEALTNVRAATQVGFARGLLGSDGNPLELFTDPANVAALAESAKNVGSLAASVLRLGTNLASIDFGFFRDAVFGGIFPSVQRPERRSFIGPELPPGFDAARDLEEARQRAREQAEAQRAIIEGERAKQAALRRSTEVQNRYNAAIDASLTPQQKANREIAFFKQALDDGLLSAERFRRVSLAIQSTVKENDTELSAFGEQAKRTFEDIKSSADGFVGSLSEGLAELLVQGRFTFAALAQAAAQAFVATLIAGGIRTAVGGVTGLISQGGGGGGGGGVSALTAPGFALEAAPAAVNLTINASSNGGGGVDFAATGTGQGPQVDLVFDQLLRRSTERGALDRTFRTRYNLARVSR